MVKVEVLSDFFVEATSAHYMTGWKGEVSNELAHRHGKDGTGFLGELPEDAELTPLRETVKEVTGPSKTKSTKAK